MVPRALYLDTARLGRMSAGARRVVRDFAGLASEVGLPLYCEDFLRTGFSVLPSSLQRRLPALACWSGISSLKTALRQVAGCTDDVPVFVANRSTQLMKLATGTLFTRCRSVLTTDIDWPAYCTLHQKGQRKGHAMHVVTIRDAILRERATPHEIVRRIAVEFLKRECDGLFLTAVSHDGLRLPVEEIVRKIELKCPVKMVVVDGAQDFCHARSRIDTGWCDFYITGCHKWLRAHQPMGVMFTGRRSSQESIETALAERVGRGEIDDPLLRFTQQIERHCLDEHTETVNVSPLFSCAGAVQEALSCFERSGDQHRQQLMNATIVAELAETAGWKPLLPAPLFRSGILILESCQEATTRLSPRQLQSVFHELGVSLTAYENGRIRLSMPKWPLAGCDLDQLRKSLQWAG